MNGKYFELVKTKKKEAELTIYGDITSFPYEEQGQVGAYNLSKQLNELKGVSTINVHINSYGGEVAEGLAIYNALKNHEAKIRTYCDGFACSIASVIFMAGDERIMSKSSLLMIHNAWTFAQGNATELRKQADDLEIITSASINAYMESINVSEKELKQLLDNETWLTPEEALEKGFATKINEDKKNKNANQSVRNKLFQMLVKARQEEKSMDEKLLDILNQFKDGSIDEETAIENINSLFDTGEDDPEDPEEKGSEDPEEPKEPEEPEEPETGDNGKNDDEEDKKQKIREKNVKFFSAFYN